MGAWQSRLFQPPALGLLFLWSLLLWLSRTPAVADNGWEKQILSVNEENDAIASSDRHYTQGVHLSYLSADDTLPKWTQGLSRRLPAIGLTVAAQKYGIALGQEIYTPEDLRRQDVILNDRPYAGWLFLTASLQRRGLSASIPAMETFRVDLGIVGPESLGEQTQKLWHGEPPRGWRHQLKSEPGMNLGYGRSYLFSSGISNRWRADLIPRFFGSLGNVSTFLGVGSTLRFGYQVPNEFEARTPAAPPRLGAYLLGGVQGRWVARNLFLDGNTFRSSYGVESKPFVADLMIGCTVVLKRVELTVARNFRTREFDRQHAADSYGSVTLTFKF